MNTINFAVLRNSLHYTLKQGLTGKRKIEIPQSRTFSSSNNLFNQKHTNDDTYLC